MTTTERADGDLLTRLTRAVGITDPLASAIRTLPTPNLPDPGARQFGLFRRASEKLAAESDGGVVRNRYPAPGTAQDAAWICAHLAAAKAATQWGFDTTGRAAAERHPVHLLAERIALQGALDAVQRDVSEVLAPWERDLLELPGADERPGLERSVTERVGRLYPVAYAALAVFTSAGAN